MKWSILPPTEGRHGNYRSKLFSSLIIYVLLLFIHNNIGRRSFPCCPFCCLFQAASFLNEARSRHHQQILCAAENVCVL